MDTRVLPGFLGKDRHDNSFLSSDLKQTGKMRVPLGGLGEACSAAWTHWKMVLVSRSTHTTSAGGS